MSIFRIDADPVFADFRIYKSSDYLLLVCSWDLPGNKLVPADYDSDGRADIAVFRNGAWYIKNTTSGITTAQFGISSDTAVPNAYIGQ